MHADAGPGGKMSDLSTSSPEKWIQGETRPVVNQSQVLSWAEGGGGASKSWAPVGPSHLSPLTSREQARPTPPLCVLVPFEQKEGLWGLWRARRGVAPFPAPFLLLWL